MANAGRLVTFPIPTGGGPGVSYASISTGQESSAAISAETAVASPVAGPASTIPRIIPVMNLGSAELRLRAPLFVNIEESDGFIVASCYDLELAEQGETEFDALDALREAVIELYRVLRELPAGSHPHLRHKLEFLEGLAR